MRQRSEGVTQFKCHQHSLEGWVLYRHWIIEHYHHAVTGVAFEGAVVLDDDFADGRMVVAQQGHHVFSIGAFREPSEATQVTEQRSYLSSMALELLLAPRRYDQIGHLRRQETPQPAHTLDFAYLVCDALFELLVEFNYFVCSLAQFLQQSRIFDGNGGLVSERLDQSNLFLCEWLHVQTVNQDDAKQIVAFEDGNGEDRAVKSLPVPPMTPAWVRIRSGPAVSRQDCDNGENDSASTGLDER